LPHHPRHGGDHHDRTRDAACHASQIGQSAPGPAAPDDAWTRSPANLSRSSVSVGMGDHDRSTCAPRPCPEQRADTAHGGEAHLAQPPDGGSGSVPLGAAAPSHPGDAARADRLSRPGPGRVDPALGQVRACCRHRQHHLAGVGRRLAQEGPQRRERAAHAAPWHPRLSDPAPRPVAHGHARHRLCAVDQPPAMADRRRVPPLKGQRRST
jgi:hypothetical protein